LQEREADLRMERHLDMNPYDPWGKAGAGAPNRDADGNIISNLRGHVGIRYPNLEFRVQAISFQICEGTLESGTLGHETLDPGP
jgi:hypothetical protein